MVVVFVKTDELKAVRTKVVFEVFKKGVALIVPIKCKRQPHRPCS